MEPEIKIQEPTPAEAQADMPETPQLIHEPFEQIEEYVMAQPKKEQTMFLLQLVAENFTIQRDDS